MSRSGWVATASATGGTNVTANAIDSNPSTRWSPGVNQASGQYFQVDMLSPRTFVQLRLATAPFATDYPRAFQVSVSNDGTNFGTPIATGAGTTTPTTISFAPQTARFVRVTLTTAAANLWSIADFDVITTTLPRTGWFATATSTNGSNAAANALDGVATTKWTSAGAQTAQSFQVDMAARQTFSQLTLDSGSSTNNFPRSYSVFVSNDWSNFGTAVVTGTATASPVIINLPTQFAQYIKITAGTNAASWTIAELTVNGQPTVQTTLPRSGWTATATSTNSTTTTAGALDGNTATRWSSAGAQTGQSFTVDMRALRTFNQITADAGTTSTQYPRHYALFVSNDGVNFGSAVATGTVSGALAVMNPPTQTARYLKIVQDATNTSPWSIQELNVFGPSVAQSGWNATPSSTGGTDLASNAIDGQAGTRWTSGAPQSNGQTFQVDLGAAQIINQITLDAGTSTGDYPRGYSVSLSSDGTTFGVPVATGVGSNQVLTINFATTTARAIRITQTGTAANAWSIHELNVARIAQPCDTATCTASDTCHTGTCDPNTGLCSSQARPDGQACNDGSLCTINDTCLGGVCQGGIGTTCAAGPNVTFYQSYDNGTTVDFAAGSPYARVPNPLIQVPGVYGPGIDSTTSFELSYATNVNMSPTSFVASKPGSFSMWVKPSAQYSGFFVRMFDNNANTTFDLGGNATAITAQFSYGGGTYVAATSPWTPDARWHLIVVNWSRLAAEISIDGVAPVPSTFGGGPSFVFGPNPGNLIYAGAEARPSYAKDEFLILNRPLTNSEIQSYYQQGKAGGMPAPNPIIAQLNAGGIACNPFDDLNPCTADSCDPSMGGVKHAWVDDGTPCSDANMCNGAETCHSGVCTSGAPVACADACHQAGSCDPPTGTCTQGTPIDKIGCNITLNPVNVVDMGDGTFTAIFGYNSTATTPFHPTTNTVSLNGSVQPNYQPAPPAYLPPGNHPDAYLPTFTSGQTVTWTLDGQPLLASASSPKLTPTPFGTDGQKVTVGRIDVIVKPDLAKYSATPQPPDQMPQDEPQLGPAFKGVLKGNLTVSPSGAATYTVPISIPPGIAGVAPNLNLVYSSQSGLGIAGQGWELAGLSMIHRCAKTRVQDGLARAVDLSAIDASMDPLQTDGVCVDGKRLFMTSMNNLTVTYEGESKTFSDIVFNRDTGTFVVVTKTGEIHYYGSGPLSRVADPGGQVAVWALDRVMDRWGNYYDIHYNNDQGDFQNRGLIATEMDYTGKSDATNTGSGTNPPFASVKLTYQPRQDVRTVRFDRLTNPRNQLLAKIQTDNGHYDLAYETFDPMLSNRLHSIRYCAPVDGGSDTCLPDLIFDWDGGGYSFEPAPGFVLPPGVALASSQLNGPVLGTRLVDLDGDGLVDLISAMDGRPSHVWRNDGTKWVPQDDWKLPFNLYDASQHPIAMLADVDGDGLLDIVKAGNVPAVKLNRLHYPGGLTWVDPPGYATVPAGWGATNFNTTDAMLDVNGDNKADIVRLTAIVHDDLHILLNTGTGWRMADQSDGFQFGPINGQPNNSQFHDFNHDGLPDYGGFANTGAHLPGNSPSGSVWRRSSTSNGEPFSPAVPSIEYSADLDGDGLYDAIEYPQRSAVVFGTRNAYTATGSGLFNAVLSSFTRFPDVNNRIELFDANGDGLADLAWRNAVDAPQPGQAQGVMLVNTGNSWVDLKGKTTASEWTQADNTVPVVPWILHHAPFFLTRAAIFVDLDGDGLSDRIQAAEDSELTPTNGAWLNRFRRPVIKRFPNGLASKAIVTYGGTNAGTIDGPTYSDSGILDAGTTFLSIPLRLVGRVEVDDGVGGTSITRYQYKDLRASATGRGPQGFRQTIVRDPAGIITTTTYARAYPYTGSPVAVSREDHGPSGSSPVSAISTTATSYCDRIPSASNPCTPLAGGVVPPLTTVFVHPTITTDVTYLRTSVFPEPTAPPATLTTSALEFDNSGNVTKTTVTTTGPAGDTYRKEIKNDYTFPGSERYGQPAEVTTTTSRLFVSTVPSIVHMTAFEYGQVNNPIPGVSTFMVLPGVLSKTIAEPGAPGPGQPPVVGLGLVTAYDHDRFGNIITTTDCAVDFDHCVAGGLETIATDTPFRTTRVSYAKSDYLLPPGNGLMGQLPYGDGRFPVKTTNAVGHVSVTVYDRRFGTILQATDANNVSSCFSYDPFGRKTAEVSRCGTTVGFPITTTFDQFETPDHSTLARVIAVTRPPLSSPAWAYTDVFGRVIQTKKRSFDGGFVDTKISYDHFGRVGEETPSFLESDHLEYTSSRVYDVLDRVESEARNLGNISGGNPSVPVMTTVTYTYGGPTTTTDRTVRGIPRERVETKNALGKVASVTVTSTVDIGNTTTTFEYDPDGNIKRVTDPVVNQVTMDYDTRGRKTAMSDPDLGNWSYVYDGFGDLVSQTDGKGKVTTMTYDRLGRMTSRTDADGKAEWVFDIAPGAGKSRLAAMVSPSDPWLAGNCSIPGTSGSGGTVAGKSYSYDVFGKLVEVDECVDGEVFKTNYAFDDVARDKQVTYPAVNGGRYVVNYNYTKFGYLHFVSDTAGKALWVAKTVDALGNVTDQVTRNGVETVANVDRAVGWALGSLSTAHADGETVIQNLSHTFDEAGNLLTRSRSDQLNPASSQETFTYDPLDRLKTSEVTIASTGYDATESFSYDSIGNLTLKSGQSYTYSGCMAGSRPAGPHAVCVVGTGGAFSYDGNGNMVAGADRTLAYSGQNRVRHVERHPSPSQGRDTGAVDLVYGADQNRVVQIATTSGDSVTSRTVYVGLGGTGKSLYERTTHGGDVEHIHFIYAGSAHGGSAFALRVVAGNGSEMTKYNHFDHLGSVTAMSDDRGHVVSASWGGANATMMAYDPWGARRNPDGTGANPASFSLQPGRREYTGHETMPNTGIVNMNGRVYDPVLGRFFSPDPNVQFPSDLQSYNRYAYAQNNPLHYTDPTGYSVSGSKWGDTAIGIGIALVGTVACGASEGAACPVAMALMEAWWSATTVLADGGSLEEALFLGFAGAVTGQMGNLAGSAVASAIANQAGAAAAQMAAGAVSGAVTAAMMDLGTTGTLGWKNILTSAAIGAFMAGATAAIRGENPVSEAGQAQEDGDHVFNALKDGGGDGKPLGFDIETRPGLNDFQLDARTRAKLQPVFGPKVNLDDVRLSFYDDPDIKETARFVASRNRIFLSQDFHSLNSSYRDYLLVHEVAHYAQFVNFNFNVAKMDARGDSECIGYACEGSYRRSEALKSTSLSDLNIIDSRFKLEAIAHHVGLSVSGYQFSRLSWYRNN